MFYTSVRDCPIDFVRVGLGLFELRMIFFWARRWLVWRRLALHLRGHVFIRGLGTPYRMNYRSLGLLPKFDDNASNITSRTCRKGKLAIEARCWPLRLGIMNAVSAPRFLSFVTSVAEFLLRFGRYFEPSGHVSLVTYL